MSGPRDLSASTYAREIERRWSRLTQCQFVLSPREWTLVSRWHARGIPLQIVEESMTALLERGRTRGESPPRLARAARAVDEAWTVVIEGRLARDERPAPEGGDVPADTAWRAAREHEREDSPLWRLLEDLLRRHDQGETAQSLDEDLETRLPESADPPLRDALQAEIDQEMEPFRGRMSGERFDETRRRALVDRLRKRLKLPRLAPGRR